MSPVSFPPFCSPCPCNEEIILIAKGKGTERKKTYRRHHCVLETKRNNQNGHVAISYISRLPPSREAQQAGQAHCDPEAYRILERSALPFFLRFLHCVDHAPWNCHFFINWKIVSILKKWMSNCQSLQIDRTWINDICMSAWNYIYLL